MTKMWTQTTTWRSRGGCNARRSASSEHVFWHWLALLLQELSSSRSSSRSTWGEEEEEEEEDAFQSDDDVNTDGMSYEQLLAIGEANGAVSKGASAKSLVSVLTTCRLCDVPGARVDEQCSVCRDEFADMCCEVTVLPCKHYFHGECITPWLKVNRACPLCFQDVVAASTATDNDR